MNFKQGIPVEEFKRDFYAKTTDLTLYDCADFNLLKVVLDGLKVNYISKGKFRTPLFYPDLAFNVWQSLQLKRNKPNKPFPNSVAKVMIVDLSGRSETKQNGIPTSFYFQELIDSFERKDLVHVVENFKEVDYPHEIDLRKYQSLQFLPLSESEKQIRKDLLETYQKISRSKKFDNEELANIKVAIQVFFSQFKIWNELLALFPNIKDVLIEQHYHHEGLLLALRKKNIRSTEVQHGLIAPSDIFYVFPSEVASVRSRALFPSRIFVYGQYWKDVLKKGSEFAEDKIVVTGDFRKKNQEPGNPEDKKNIEAFIGRSNIILIGGQTFISDFFSSYVNKLSSLLSEKHPEWKIVMKLHPNEKIEDYASVSSLPNVLVTRTNIHYLFKRSKIHISVYSTTLYDSLEYGIVNFSLDHEKFRDYTRDILNDKIALPLSVNEDPIQKFQSHSYKAGVLDPSKVYSPFDKQLLQNLILN